MTDERRHARIDVPREDRPELLSLVDRFRWLAADERSEWYTKKLTESSAVKRILEQFPGSKVMSHKESAE